MISERRLWVVSELYYPEQTSTGYFLTRIAEGLASSMPVHVICGQPTYSEQGIRASAKEVRNGVIIHRLRATRFAKDRLILRVVNMLTLSLAATWFALCNLRVGDRLLIVTNPPTLPPLIGWIARWKGVESSLLVHDVYPEVLAATGFLRSKGLSYRLLQRLSASTFALFGSIVVLGRDMAALVEEKLGPIKLPIVIIPNWGDVDEIGPLSRTANPFFAKEMIDQPYVFQFSGNIGRTHDVELILSAAKRLRHRTDILFLFVGYGGKLDVIARATSDGKLPNIRLLPRQPRDMLGPMLACATATIIPFVDAMKGISVPSRMYNIMAAGTPIIAIADPQSELAMVVVEDQAGWLLPPGDDAALAALIVELATKAGAAEARRRGANGHQAVVQKYTLKQILKRYRALIG